MNPKISVFTPTFNKPNLVCDAINSVLNQTYQNFEYFILENSNDGVTRKIIKDKFANHRLVKYIETDFTDEQRKEKYPTALLLNEYYPQATGEYIFYLSDDDYLINNAFELLVGFINETEKDVIYFSQETLDEAQDGTFQRVSEILAIHPRGKDTDQGVGCQIDGGQIIHRKNCLDKISQPYFDYTYPEASVCDGSFMEKLAAHYTFFPVGVGFPPLMIKRRSKLSTFVASQL